VQSTVSLGGISSAQFDTKAKNGFKSAVAKLAGVACGSASNLVQCTLNNVDINGVSDVRRDISVSYTLYAASAAAATSATSTLAAVSTDDFKKAVNEGFKNYGSSIKTTGVTVTSAPQAGTTSSSSSSGLGGGAIAGIVIACIVAVVIVVVIIYFVTRKRDQNEGTNYNQSGGSAITGQANRKSEMAMPTMGDNHQNDSSQGGQI
jgi:hypothetical protein